MSKFHLDFEKPLFDLERQLEELKTTSPGKKEELAREIKELQEQIEKIRSHIYSNLTPWQKVQIARHPERPVASNYIDALVANYIDLHGDRVIGDDGAIIGGFGAIEKHKVVIVGQEKGKNTKERIRRNFGMPHPEGFRKSLRLAKLAEKFNLPLVCIIDTSGAYPGIEAEERGQALAIANNIMEFSKLRTRILSVNIGEGGSGGALAFGVADRTLMMENAYYSVISPEACSAILFGDSSRTSKAASFLKLTAEDLFKAGFIDEIIDEPLGGAHCDRERSEQHVYSSIVKNLDKLIKQPVDKLLDKRFKKLRKIGAYKELKK